MNDLDLSQATSIEDLARCVRRLHVRADSPSLRTLEDRTKHANGLLPGTRIERVPLRRTTLSEVLQGRIFPRKAILLTFVEACGVDLETDRRWEQAWDRLAEDRVSSESAPAAGALRMDPIRVLIADGHALFRRGLEMVLETEDDIDLVGQASDGVEAVAVAGKSQPHVVLMDVRMPKISGIEACRAIREIAPSAKIVMLTISDEEEDLFDAIRAGASGYLLKDMGAALLR